MKVSSPIGELPFEPKKLRFRRGFVELEGVMGAWPARVEISLADAPALLRVLRVPLIVAAAAVVLIAAVLVAVLVTR